MSTAKQPHWRAPMINEAAPSLHIINSLTREKNLFVPRDGNNVSWYICGPTVYNKSHLGHARTYIAFDIIRRLMEDYFGYDVLFVMNITDVDDKIILSARQQYIFTQFVQSNPVVTQELLDKSREAWWSFVSKKFAYPALSQQNMIDWEAFLKIPAPSAESEPKFQLFLSTAHNALRAITQSTLHTSSTQFFEQTKDVISFWLDIQEGHLITDPKIYREFTNFWEKDFFEDMDKLGVKRPDILTRVSEYVPEIVDYTKVIMENGFAYESKGSIYFDTLTFGSSDKHDYAKLCPWSAGNTKLSQEGEGDLSVDTDGKRNPSDFALWKAAKAGEPFWESPWGNGRPGWHIECSVMASAVLGKSMDIHSGGIDLAFPHHDNELAQSEAYYGCQQWVNYFIHTGHLHIQNLKMSKSLKNFLSIKETLEISTAPQLRIMFLLHNWETVLDYNPSSIAEAKLVLASLQNFIALVEALNAEKVKGIGHNYGPLEANLMKVLLERQNLVRAALCDSFNTPAMMSEFRLLISTSNQYYSEKQKLKERPNSDVLNKIAAFVTKIMRIVGVFDPLEVAKTVDFMPTLRTMSAFRDEVRQLAQAKAEPHTILKLCDDLRDEKLIEHGVVLEDRDGTNALVKLVDAKLLIQQREERLLRDKIKEDEKKDRLQKELQKRREKLEKGRLVPKLMFQNEEYSEWDQNVSNF